MNYSSSELNKNYMIPKSFFLFIIVNFFNNSHSTKIYFSNIKDGKEYQIVWAPKIGIKPTKEGIYLISKLEESTEIPENMTHFQIKVKIDEQIYNTCWGNKNFACKKLIGWIPIEKETNYNLEEFRE